MIKRLVASLDAHDSQRHGFHDFWRATATSVTIKIHAILKFDDEEGRARSTGEQLRNSTIIFRVELCYLRTLHHRSYTMRQDTRGR